MSWKRFASLAIAIATSMLVHAQVEPIHVSDKEAADHRLSHHDAIRISHRDHLHSYVAVDVVVDTAGGVISAKAIEGPPELFGEAESLVKVWKYTPFERRGVATSAAFRDYVLVLPPEQLPQAHVPFPEVRDWRKLKMTLERSLCYGMCPSYKVEIDGDGTVSYQGNSYVAVKGAAQAHITRDDVVKLLDLFRAADYFSLPAQYRAMVTDNPTFTTSISIDGTRKTVVDYVGQEVGMPQSVTDLEIGIDRIVNTRKWIDGTTNSAKPH